MAIGSADQRYGAEQDVVGADFALVPRWRGEARQWLRFRSRAAARDENGYAGEGEKA